MGLTQEHRWFFLYATPGPNGLAVPMPPPKERAMIRGNSRVWWMKTKVFLGFSGV